MKLYHIAIGTDILSVAKKTLLSQHYDPVTFFLDLERQGIWRSLWPTRLITMLFGVLILPRILFALSGEPFVALSTAVAVTVLLFVSGFFMLLSSPIAGLRPGLWLAYLFLYHFSFPMLVVVLLCALAPLTPIGLWLGWYVGVPVALGVSLVDACSLAVYQSAQQQREKRARLRQGGPPADLPELSRQQLAWTLRLLTAGLLLIGALVIRWLYAQEGAFLSVMMVCAAAGCVRLESILLAALGQSLVYYNDQQKCWRATYVGRTALWVGRNAILHTILSLPNSRDANAVLLALLQESSLSLAIQRSYAYLPLSFQQALLLRLSLCEGGAEALRFLCAGLPVASAQKLARCYADLAAEAAKPPDLQRWIALLPEASAVDGTTIDHDLVQLLALTRTALLQYRDQPVIARANQEVRQFLQSLYEGAPLGMDGVVPSWPLSWPMALALQLEQHQQRLRASE